MRYGDVLDLSAGLSGTVNIDRPTRIVGGGVELAAPSARIDAIHVRAPVRVEHLVLSGWRHGILVGADVDGFEVVDSTFVGLTGRAVALSSIDHALTDVLIRGCIVGGAAGGFVLNAGTYDRVRVLDNRISNLSASESCHGVAVGSDSGLPMSAAWVEGNRIHDLSGAGETHAIIVRGDRVSITGNDVDTVATSSGDCEGIYTKATRATITSNTLRDAGSGSGGAIQVKGVNRGEDGTPGYGAIVESNHILETREVFAKGLSVYASGAQVRGNVVEGCDGPSIYVPHGLVSDLDLIENDVVAFRGTVGIHLRNHLRDVRLLRNRVRDGGRAKANVRGIWVQLASDPSAVASRLEVEGNRVSGLTGSSTTGLSLTASAGSTIDDVMVRSNRLEADEPYEQSGTVTDVTSDVGAARLRR